MQLYATDSISNKQIQYAAAVAADLLDNDNNGIADDPRLCARLRSVSVVTPMFEDEDEEEKFDYEYSNAALFKGEVRPDGPFPGYWDPDTYLGDATVEEILHNINGQGHRSLYPDAFGTEPDQSLLTEAMDIARGGQFIDPVIPCGTDCDDDGDCEKVCYPDEAWYHYHDGTCDYWCMTIEYIYWGIVTNMNLITPELCKKIKNEWQSCDKNNFKQTDPRLYNLINDPVYKMPTVAPDGQYCCCGGPTCNSPILWVSEEGCLDHTLYTGKYSKIGRNEFSGYIHEGGQYQIQFDGSNWAIYNGGKQDEIIKMLGDGECAPGIFNGIRVSAENLPEKFKNCKTCGEVLWSDRCQAPCNNDSFWSECKCFMTGSGPECKKCPSGEQFYGDTGTCVAEVTNDTCEPEWEAECQLPCELPPVELYGDCKCVMGRIPRCAQCPTGEKF